MYRFSALLVSVLSLPLMARAVPLERFETPFQLSCDSDQTCVKTVRSKLILGGSVGFALHRVDRGELKLGVTKEQAGILTLEGSSVQSLRLTWDGDSNPEQLSGAGLGCFDLTAQGAQAVVIRDLAIEAQCGTGEAPSPCEDVEVEARLYDADDATGQRFSALIQRQSSRRAASELVLPFSGFVREGPRGLARLSCVGAISLSFRLGQPTTVKLSLGPIFTNGAEGLSSIPSPTPTMTPTATETPVLEEVAVEASPSVLPESTGTPSGGATGEAAEALPDGAPRALAFGPPAKLEVFEEERLEQVEVPHLNEESQEPVPPKPAFVPEETEEVVYGAVVAGGE
jgi:hypothetical protein